MTVFLTISSANYLAQAKTLADSVREHHPDAHTVLGLVDRVPASVPPAYWSPHELLPVESLAIPTFTAMAAKYDLVELNTAVKPFYIEHLYRRDEAVREVIYLDPDILVLGRLDKLLDDLTRYLLVVTPHSVTPSDEPAAVKMEVDMLKTGVYNLGFLGTSRRPRVFEFLRWWQRRLEQYCFYRTDLNLFVDQLWMDLAPHFFGDTLVDNDLGYNVCYWNAYERTLSRVNGRYVVNGEVPVTFYHFSSYDAGQPDIMVRRYGTPFPSSPEPRALFEQYRARLLQNDFETVSKLPCAFAEVPVPPVVETGARLASKRLLQRAIRWGLKTLPARARNRLGRAGRFLMDNC